VENCVVLMRELKEQGYAGSYTILKEFVHPLRGRSSINATMRFETAPGEQVQVDFGSFPYRSAEGTERRVWGFLMVLSYSRMAYLEFVPRADVTTFIRCHLNGFDRLGGIARRCLYDNAKLVVLHRNGSGQPVWNERFLDFALRLGFEVRLCRPYRPQTKGRVESGIKYVKGNFWPSASSRTSPISTASASMVRHGGCIPAPRNYARTAGGPLGAGETPAAAAAGPGTAGSLPAGRPEGGPRRVRVVEPGSLRRSVEPCGEDGAGAGGAGVWWSCGRAMNGSRCIRRPPPGTAADPARPVGGAGDRRP
jgi:hypothetical protein